MGSTSVLITLLWIVFCGVDCGEVVILRNQNDGGDDRDVVYKCCSLGHGLHKIVDANETISYACIDPSENPANTTTQYEEPLFIIDSNNINYGFPEVCKGLLYSEYGFDTNDHLPSVYCLDKVLNEDSAIAGSIVILTCEKQSKNNAKPKIMNTRKCCRDGKVYDPWIKMCRNTTESLNIFEEFVRPNSNLLDVSYGMKDCVSPKFVVDYVGEFYHIKLIESDVIVEHKTSLAITELTSGSFCVDGTVDGDVVVRGCREDCDSSICITKCCPEGEIFVRNDCKRGPKCTKLENEFSPDFFEEDGSNIFRVEPAETFGVRYGVHCSHGKYKIERTESRSQPDFHYIHARSGHLIVPNFPPEKRIQKEFCTEMTDQRVCGLEMHMETLVCFAVTVVGPKFAFMSIGAMISCVFLFLTIAVYLAIPELRNLHGKTLMSHAIAMLAAYSCLAYVQGRKVHNTNICISLGYIIYFSFVAAFSWLNIMCFDIWWTFGSARTVQTMRRPQVERRRFIYYSLYAWGLSLLLTGITTAVDFTGHPHVLDPNIGQNACWFASEPSRLPHYILFVLPMGLQILTNCVLFILTAIHCNKVKSEIHRLQAGSMGDRCKRRFMSDKAKYTLNLKLFIVMGITWFWEFVSNLFDQPEELWYVADFLNLLQGVPIFCILVLKRKVFRLIRKKLGCEKKNSRQSNVPSSSTATTGVSSSTNNAGGYKNGRLCSTSSYGSERSSMNARNSMRNSTFKSITVTQEENVITLKTS